MSEEYTETQKEALRKLAGGDCSPFDFGAGTVAWLRRRGFVETVRPKKANLLRITEAGRAEAARFLSPGGVL